MSSCFVIQPFDKGRFDKRFDDVFSPAITECGLTPYRVDRDPNVTIPIEDIESGIRSSTVCLAEITLDNPNVWFELGFAFAMNRPVVLLCSDERETGFPFDVQHRAIIRYSSESTSDFNSLQERIVERLKVILEKGESLAKISSSSALAPVEGLSQQELITLAALAENLAHSADVVVPYQIYREVEAAGFTKMAVVIGLKSLFMKKLIISEIVLDRDSGENYTGYSITEAGWEWILRNQEFF